MLRAFLSHSSKQKGYVDVVARHLGASRLVYDTLTFEEGNKTFDEILHGLSETSLFVLFISEEALQSTWVTSEIEKAHELISAGNIRRLYPIIIDHHIRYDDDRIPAWIRDNYNLKYVSKPTKAAERIGQILKTLTWEIYPKNRDLAQLFVGRTELIRQYEERIFNYEKPIPLLLVTAGMPSIGRRKFTTHCLKNSNKIREGYAPPTIVLGSRDSIEDFVIGLYDLGLSQKRRNELLNLLDRDMDDKISLATELLLEIEKHEAIVFVVDNYAIVGRDGVIIDWFRQIVSGLSAIQRLFVCLISRNRVRHHSHLHGDNIFGVEVPELERYERNALFRALLDLENCQISPQDFGTICELFNGFPEQVFFTFENMISEGLPYVMNNLHIIPDYNSEKVAHLMQEYESNGLAKQVLGFLSDCELVSFGLLESVFKEDFGDVRTIMEDFSNGFIIEFIGATREYIRLNDAIRDHIQRIGIKRDKQYTDNLESHVRSTFDQYDTLDRDMSDYFVSVKEALKRGFSIPERLLLPSHYLHAMRDLYDNERRYDYVIALADRVLLKEKYLDQRVMMEVRIWLCLSLARKRDRRLVEEVQNIDGPDHNFLLGFYYRLIGRHEDAVDRLLDVLEVSPRHYKAKRELVQVYLNLEEHQLAFQLAKDNYELLRNNPYNVQSYFRCLIRNADIPLANKRDELEKMVESLRNNSHRRAREMYMIIHAEFLAAVEHDEERALNAARDGVAAYPRSIYPRLTQIEICRAFSNWEDLELVIKSIDGTFRKDSDIYDKASYISAKVILLARAGKMRDCRALIESEVEGRFSKTLVDKIRKEVEQTQFG